MKWGKQVTNVTNTYNLTPIAVGPDDKLIVTLPAHCTVEQVEEMARQLRERAELHDRVIVVGGGIDLTVLRGES